MKINSLTYSSMSSSLFATDFVHQIGIDIIDIEIAQFAQIHLEKNQVSIIHRYVNTTTTFIRMYLSLVIKIINMCMYDYQQCRINA